MQKHLGYSEQDKMLNMCPTPQPGKVAQPGVSVRKHQGRLEVDPWGFGVGDTEDARPAMYSN